MKINTKWTAGLLTALIAVPTMAHAQDGAELAVADDDTRKARQGEPTDLDPIPRAPRPDVVDEENKLKEQSGIGSTIAYAAAGVLELGGSAGFSSNNSFTNATLSPSVGWFVADNFKVSGIVNLSYVEAGDDDGLTTSALIEPSYHLPFTDQVFGFAGVGAGVSYIEGAGTGIALQPRLGMNMLVGRSGVFTPSINVGYSTIDAESVNGRNILTVEPSVGVQAGYTVMW